MNFFSNISNLFTLKSKETSCYSFAFEYSPVATLILSKEGKIVQVNETFTDLLGYRAHDIIGESMSFLKSSEHDSLFYKALHKKISETKKHTFEIYNRCKDGSILLFQEHVTSVEHSSKDFYIITLEDITQKRKQENRQLHLATHDPLTGLANRALLNDRYKHALLNAQRNHSKLGILICDLNEFKSINDEYGHNFGDEVLKAIALRLEDLVRESDTVARYGGDEFIIILEQVGSGEKVKEKLESIMNELTFTLEHNNQSCDISASIGHACFPEEGTTFEQLVGAADLKMYKAKNSFYGIDD